MHWRLTSHSHTSHATACVAPLALRLSQRRPAKRRCAVSIRDILDNQRHLRPAVAPHGCASAMQRGHFGLTGACARPSCCGAVKRCPRPAARRPKLRRGLQLLATSRNKVQTPASFPAPCITSPSNSPSGQSKRLSSNAASRCPMGRARARCGPR